MALQNVTNPTGKFVIIFLRFKPFAGAGDECETY